MGKGFDGKAVFMTLYDTFGEELIEYGASAVKSKLDSVRAGDNNTEQDESASYRETDVIEGGSEPQTACDYQNTAAFEQQIVGKMKGSAAVVIAGPQEVAAALKELIIMAAEVRKFEEAQITARTEIAAQRDVAIANIEMQKTALFTYFDKAFDERKENFRRLFSVVDESLNQGNMQALALGLEDIIKLADSSPLKDLATIESTAAALSDSAHEWDF